MRWEPQGGADSLFVGVKESFTGGASCQDGKNMVMRKGISAETVHVKAQGHKTISFMGSHNTSSWLSRRGWMWFWGASTAAHSSPLCSGPEY